MARRIRVKLDFTIVFDRDVRDICDDLASHRWAMGAVRALGEETIERLGIVDVVKATRHLDVVDEKGRHRSE